jgi:hypothetical protein
MMTSSVTPACPESFRGRIPDKRDDIILTNSLVITSIKLKDDPDPLYLHPRVVAFHV